ncbi:MAG: alpha/beta hydrolase-fold protein [Bacteroidota bacterium]|nr:alpha/beta hydrolase-fold protein [Bacteroidota bacterium]
MFRLVFFIFLGGSVLLFSQTASKVKVTFNVKTKGISKDSVVYIVGSSKELGNWQPDSVALKKSKDGTWTKTILFEKGKSVEFKFTLGSWEKEALNPDGTTPQNHVLLVSGDTVLNYTVESFKSGKKIIEGAITGDVSYYRKMKGDGINSRDIIVWLPPKYHTDISKRYPVLYMHDGQNIIDPATSSFGVDWGADETADSLIKSGEMQGIIIVGVYNTKDRTAEYSYSDLGQAYMNFIINKLKPFIDSTYRTLPDRKNTATMGSSMGGLISLMLVWEHPEVFSKAACLSPAFKIQELNYVPFIEKYNGPDKDIKIYIDNGGIALEAELRPGIDYAIKALKEKGFKEGKNLQIFFDENAEHNERAWAKRLWRPMLFLFGNELQ